MLEALLIRWGYLAVGLGTFLEGETILLAAGAMAHRGLLSLPLVIAAAFLGSVCGDQLWFYLGRRFGAPFLEKRPAWQARLVTAKRSLDRYGNAFVLGFRFIYGVRTVTPAFLGVSRYDVSKFTLLNSLGAALWAGALGSAGWGLGAAFAGILQRSVRVEEALGGAGVLALGAWLSWRCLRRARVKTDSRSVAR